MNSVSENQKVTPEIVWEAFRETDRQLKESRANFDRELKESRADFDRRMEDYDRQRKESNADFDRQRKESNADFDRRIKKLEELTGSWANNHGAFAEDYFFNSFEKGKQNFFGERFDRIEKNVHTHLDAKIKDEYDIVFINGKSVAIIEIKYKAHERNIPQVIKKAETFRANFPNYASHQIYLGLASMSFYPKLEKECMNQGIAVVKQVGDTVVINDSNLKVF
ncbi:MAG: hypothetical protein FWD56_04970 [Bacteroidales bacterium]|nr:hypothetical protein [Bacteroidales bacterium]